MTTNRENSPARKVFLALLWIARICGTAAVVPLMLILFGESGSGPAGLREWTYLAFFPVGFSVGYLLGWRWPVLGGCIALVCMVISLAVIGRTFAREQYLVWGVLCLPGFLYVIAGLMLRRLRRAG